MAGTLDGQYHRDGPLVDRPLPRKSSGYTRGLLEGPRAASGWPKNPTLPKHLRGRAISPKAPGGHAAGSEIQPYLSSVWMRSVVNTTNPSAQLPCNFGLLTGLGP